MIPDAPSSATIGKSTRDSPTARALSPPGLPKGAMTHGASTMKSALRPPSPRSISQKRLDATRHALDLAGEGDVVVVCVDHANRVWKELQRRQHGQASEADSPGAVVGVLDADEEIEIEA